MYGFVQILRKGLEGKGDHYAIRSPHTERKLFLGTLEE